MRSSPACRLLRWRLVSARRSLHSTGRPRRRYASAPARHRRHASRPRPATHQRRRPSRLDRPRQPVPAMRRRARHIPQRGQFPGNNPHGGGADTALLSSATAPGSKATATQSRTRRTRPLHRRPPQGRRRDSRRRRDHRPGRQCRLLARPEPHRHRRRQRSRKAGASISRKSARIASFEHGPWTLAATLVHGFGSVRTNRVRCRRLGHRRLRCAAVGRDGGAELTTDALPRQLADRAEAVVRLDAIAHRCVRGSRPARMPVPAWSPPTASA